MGKNIGSAALVTAVGVFALLAPGSIDAGCPGSQFLDATIPYLVSNPNWGAADSGGDGSCSTGFGCYATESDPPVSSGMRGVFWDVGTGNPALGAGNDSGLFGGGFTAADFWLKQVSVDGFPQGLYHYPAWVSLKLGVQNVTGAPVTWSAPDADGCGPANPPDTTCTCFMMTDEWNGVGYFATMSARSDELGNTRYNLGENIVLAQIPKPRITGSARLGGGDVMLSVSHDPLSGGIYQLDSCGTCLFGFKVYGQLVSRDAAAPTARDTGWTELAAAGGGQQPATAFDGTASVLADCDALQNQDLYLAIALVGEGATPFVTSHVSQNSLRVHCGATLANPEGPGNRPTDPRPGRGRDSRDRTR